MERLCRIRKNDKVKIISGRDKGKISKVLRVLPDKGRVIVENACMVKRHTKAGGAKTKGGIVEKEGPLNIAKVMLVCDKCMNPVRIKMIYLEDGKKVRVCRKCNEVLN
ncbi:MAG: 50S ribosomal protein L24 [Pseudomonadota bacterium]